MSNGSEKQVLQTYRPPDGGLRRIVKGPSPLREKLSNDVEEIDVYVEEKTADGWVYGYRVGVAVDD